MESMIITVKQLVDELSKFDNDDKLRVIDSNGFTLMGIKKVVDLDGRVTIIPDYQK